jgi:hypothetical protein
MVSEKALYWMAVGVMAFSLGNHFASRYDGKCLADRSLEAVQELSGQASHFVAMAGAMLGRAPLPRGLTETQVAGIQARLASVDTVMARQQAACARLEVERARMVASQQLRQMRLEVVCPRQTLKVNVPRPVDGTI